MASNNVPLITEDAIDNFCAVTGSYSLSERKLLEYI